MARKKKTASTGSSNPVLLLYWNDREALDQGTLDYWKEWLSPEEKIRLKKIDSELRQRDFLIGRALARSSLAVVLECEPGEVPLSTDGAAHESGPLQLPEELGLSLNLSHSNGEIVFAVGEGRRLGIDLEAPAIKQDYSKLVEKHFSADERNIIKELTSKQDQEDAFRLLWTAKEACLKSLGGDAGANASNLQIQFDLKRSLLNAKETQSEWQRGIPLLPISRARFIPTQQRQENWWIYWVKLPTSWACVALQPVSDADVPPPLMIENWGDGGN
jgi:phosphopantetheinyl transferase